MELLGESSDMVIAGIILTIAAFILHLIGFATPYWIKVGVLHQGLWKFCYKDTCVTYPSNFLTNQFKGAQALECLAFIAFLATIVVIVLKLKVMKDQPMLYIFMALGNFIAGGFAMLGVIVFGNIDGYGPHLHFSYVFCIIAALAAFAAGALIIIERNKQTRSEQNGQT